MVIYCVQFGAQNNTTAQVPHSTLHETACTKIETRDMNSIKRKSVLGRKIV